MFKKLTYVGVSVFVATGVLWAQEIGGGTLNGTVTDPSGGAIPAAKVTATQTSTGTTRSTQASSAGLYTLSALPAGTYDLSIEANGFKTAKLAAVPLAVG